MRYRLTETIALKDQDAEVVHLVEVEDDQQELHGDETIVATFSDYELGERMAAACVALANGDAALTTTFGDRLKAQVLDAAIDKMGWPEINAFHAELDRGQDITEDAGGFVMRAIRRLFGRPSNKPTVQTYQDAARAMVRAAESVA